MKVVVHEGAEYLTVDSLASVRGVHAGTIRKWIRKGQISAHQARLPGDRVDRWLISIDELGETAQ